MPITVLARPLLQRRTFATAITAAPDDVLVGGGYDDAILPTDATALVRIPAEPR